MTVLNGKIQTHTLSFAEFMKILIILAVLVWPAAGSAGTTTIHVYTDHGGNLDWGAPAAWDGSYENANGALFWNQSDWICNDTYGHMYFWDLINNVRVGNYSGIEDHINSVGSRAIQGYTIVCEEYSYSIGAKDGGTYTYTGLRHRIHQPDGTDIWAYSRGNGNGTGHAYFDIMIQDTSPGGITTIKEGGVVSDLTGSTFDQAINNPLSDASVMGQFVTLNLSDKYNMYYLDTNGGDEMGGMSYIMASKFLPPPKTVQAYAQAQTYMEDFRTHFKNDEGQLQSFVVYPVLLRETYAAASSIPTLNEWGMIVVSLLFATAAVIHIRRNKTKHSR